MPLQPPPLPPPQLDYRPPESEHRRGAERALAFASFISGALVASCVAASCLAGAHGETALGSTPCCCVIPFTIAAVVCAAESTRDGSKAAIGFARAGVILTTVSWMALLVWLAIKGVG